jgi:hypothetical protein
MAELYVATGCVVPTSVAVRRDTPASPRRAAGDEQGFGRKPRTMELRRTAVQRLALKYGTGRNGTQLSGA